MKTNELETIINEALKINKIFLKIQKRRYLMLSMKQLNLLTKDLLE